MRTSFVLVVGLGWALAGTVAWAQEPDYAAHDCTDAGCHAPMVEQRHVHPAVEDGGCESCHVEGDASHEFEPVEEAPDLCETCHDLEDGGVWDHADGEAVCTDCHDPHGSKWEKMLVEPVRDLCRTCHDAPGADSAHPHRPAEEGRCTACHHPHYAEEPPLLRASMPELCVRCHRDKRPIEGQSGAHLVELGEECTTCHAPHGGDLEYFLEDSFAAGLYLEDPEEQVALCLTCHGDLLEEDGDTAFLSGTGANLHLAHVGIEGKGRNCRDCHEMHARGRYRLLRKDYRMGGWTARMLYARGETEATCSPACHEPRSYPIEP